MEREVQQLVDMGATPAQARAALKQYKDVMEAAEQIFDGRFDHVKDDEPTAEPSGSKKRPATPDDDDDAEMGSEDEFEDDDDDDGADYMDYDSDLDNAAHIPNEARADPYAGIFFSKDRREEVVEVEEDSEVVTIPELSEKVKLMTQGEWMKGCPEGGEQAFLFSLYTHLSEGEAVCPNGCGTKYQRQKKDFFAIYPSFDTYVRQLQKTVRKTCNKCQSDFCLVCGETFSAERANRPGASISTDPLFHCSDIQGAVLGVGLFMLEKLFYEQKEKQAEVEGERQTKRRKTENVVNTMIDGVVTAIPQVGLGRSAKGGTGYAGDLKEDNTGQLEAQATQKAKDERLAELLHAIREYLPNLHREGGGQTSDYLVHPTALAHLRRRFNHVCSSLLRNDSLADMSDRTNLYFELLHWLETISNHEALASMMAMPIMVVLSVKPNQQPKGNNSRSVRERTVTYEGSPGPRELLEVISIQAQAALKGLEGTKPRETVTEELTEEQKRMTVSTKGKDKEQFTELLDDNQKLSDFCRRILTTANAIDRSLRDTKGDAFVDRLHASLPKLSAPSTNNPVTVEVGASDAEIEKQYVDWATSVRFEYCDLTIAPTNAKAVDDDDYCPHFKFFYNNEARMLANSDIPKRSLAIAKELAVLTTNLPVAWASSVFLRVDETRIDVIKVLITGPEGTPYENGCYCFDVFLGPSYNQAPPSVKYMTTNGGKYRFNPNLYADGKVCLSLLGTWSGPGWVAGKSTLLQVLISIQSMILCDEPYLNEPGWANSGGTPQSKAYSANVRRMVVKTAMLGNLRNPPEPWEDVIRTHFKLKARAISAQLDKWVEQDDGRELLGDGGGHNGGPGGSGANFKNDVEELKGLFKELQEA